MCILFHPLSEPCVIVSRREGQIDRQTERERESEREKTGDGQSLKAFA